MMHYRTSLTPKRRLNSHSRNTSQHQTHTSSTRKRVDPREVPDRSTRLRVELVCLLAMFIPSQCFAGQPDNLPTAAENKNWPVVQELISNGVDINSAQPDGMTALHWSVYHNHQPSVEAILAAKPNVDAKTRYDITPLSIAVRQNRSQLVRLLLDQRADPNQELPGGITPLMTAARNGDAKTIQHLVDHGAKLDSTERRGQTALMWAAAYGNTRAVDALIDAGADINKTNKSAFSAMMFAAREGRLDVVKRLLRAGVDPSTAMDHEKSGGRVPRSGSTPAILAMESGHFELALLLIKAGSDPNDQSSGYAPLHALAKVRKPNRGENPDGDPPRRGSGKLTSAQFARELVAAGANVNMQLKKEKKGKGVLNTKGATPFLLASKTADLEYLKLLIELGADPTIPNADGCTSLMAVAGIGVRAVDEEAGTEPEVLEALKYLVMLGLDVNTEDKNKETAMHGAAYRCFPKVVDYLAEQGADPNVWDHKNKYGWTPLAIGHGHRPGSLKPHPPTIAALERAKENFGASDLKKLLPTTK